MDTAATMHVCNDKSLFTIFTCSLEPVGTVALDTGLNVQGEGTILI